MIIVVQIPALNEAPRIAEVIQAIPRHSDIPEWPEDAVVKVLVVDDGSQDGTASQARAAGADHVVRLKRRLGLARVFRRGLDEALRLGADYVVNIDADNQYRAEDIPALLAPILRGEADIVIGARPVSKTPHFSWIKRRLQVWGTRLLSLVTGLQLSDATSGFRAFNQDAALRLNVHTQFTYTLETLLQAAEAGLWVKSVPIAMRSVERPSRLARSSFDYIWQSLKTMPRMVFLYKPLASFSVAGLVTALPGLLLSLRFLYFHFQGHNGHIQSLILASLLLLMAFGFVALGLLGDILAGNRRLLEEQLLRMRRLEYLQPKTGPE